MELPPLDLPDPDDIAEEAVLCRCTSCNNILAYREKGRGYPVLMLTDMSEVNTARVDDENDTHGFTLTCPYCSAADIYEIDDIPEADVDF